LFDYHAAHPRRAGLSARCHVEAGDFLSEVPARGDIYVLRKVIHDWDDERARRILGTCRSAMTDGSRVLLLEMVVPPGNTPAYVDGPCFRPLCPFQ
jgi:hypothetical protein